MLPLWYCRLYDFFLLPMGHTHLNPKYCKLRLISVCFTSTVLGKRIRSWVVTLTVCKKKIERKNYAEQILQYIGKYLSPHSCGYRKGYSKETALIPMVENLKLPIDNKGFSGRVLIDLSKGFDTINHPLLLAK